MKGAFDMPMETRLDTIMKNDASSTETPNTTREFYTESFSEVLIQSIGYFAVCQFVVGTNLLVEQSGLIYAAGSNFVTLKDPDEDQFTICDIFSLRFATIYKSQTRPRSLSTNRSNTGTRSGRR